MTDVRKLSESELEPEISKLDGWSLDNGKLYKEYKFKNFVDAFGFMAKVAVTVEKLDHHPEWFNVYSTVKVHLTTHEAGGISVRDIELAREMDALTS